MIISQCSSLKQVGKSENGGKQRAEEAGVVFIYIEDKLEFGLNEQYNCYYTPDLLRVLC